MAKDQHSTTQPWILDTVPLLVVILIAVHVLAMISHPETTPAEEKGSLKKLTTNNKVVLEMVTCYAEDIRVHLEL